MGTVGGWLEDALEGSDYEGAGVGVTQGRPGSSVVAVRAPHSPHPPPTPAGRIKEIRGELRQFVWSQDFIEWRIRGFSSSGCGVATPGRRPSSGRVGAEVGRDYEAL